jgi:hypothetical protein
MEALHKDDKDRRHIGGVHGGAMTMETTMISKTILFII